MIKALKRVVESHFKEVITVASGQEAIEKLKARSDIDVVTLDFHMPGMNGIQTLEELRRINTGLPAIILSGNNIEAIVRDAGIENISIMTKPFETNDILNMLKNLTRAKDSSN